MRTTRVAVAGLVALPVLLSAQPALAAEQDIVLAVDASAWSWRRIIPAGQPVGEPSNVPAGDLAVAFDGRPDAPPAKATYLRLALGGVPAGASVTSLLLVLPLDGSVDQDATAARLVACRLAADFTGGEAVDPSVQPKEDCTSAPAGVYDATSKSMTFALTSAAVDWLSGVANTGVVVRPDPTAAVPAVAPFQLVFQGASAVTGRLTVSVPTSPVGPELAPAPAPFVPGPDPFAGSPALPFFPAPAPAPPAFVPPLVPLPTTAGVAPRPAPAAAPVLRSSFLAPDRSSAAGLATAAALGLLLLVLIAWASGAAADPRAYAAAERRRLDRLRLGSVALPVVATRQEMQSRQGRRPLSSAASSVT